MIRVNEDYIIEANAYDYEVKLDLHKKAELKNRTTGEYEIVDRFKTVGFYKDLQSAIKGILRDANRRQISEGVIALKEALKIVTDSNDKLNELLEKVLRDLS